MECLSVLLTFLVRLYYVQVYVTKSLVNIMYSVKGGWAGQTFALAKRNESEGRKSRIRRSKEERKAMVESFIKKYQESNNGNFPSLNLTHKEVGGSFYTVREIVRDVIQENRVLGPAKFTSDDLTSDQYFKQNPLGSIARDPKSYFAVSSYENHHELNNLQDTSGKMLSVTDGYHTGIEHQALDQGHAMNVDQADVINKEPVEATVVSDGYYTGAELLMVNNEHVINGSQVDVTNNESFEAIGVSDGYYTGVGNPVVDEGHVINVSRIDVINKESSESTIPEMQLTEPMVSKHSVEQELATALTPMAKVTPLAEHLIAETFPSSPVVSTTDGIEQDLGELRGLSNSPEKDIKMFALEHDEESSELNGIEHTKNSNLSDEKIEDALGNKILNNKSNTGHGKEKDLGDTLIESAKHSTYKEPFGHEFEDSNDPQARIEDGLQAKNLTKTYTEESEPSQESMQKANKHRVDDQLGGSSKRISKPTFDRINLESWQGKSKKSAKQESNPLLAIFKVFVDAFMKLWSE
ncbi:PREDICTED: uncharacterized protein LOC109335131 isoform X2 [Lupinus angustifolius]|uniref:uncharacterized protein LOC109335131 isoform X2 n=1 Tax=Lupinus angustifolius TaxID=3871 RepID=UPI00092EE228|nr:PREDICTED: uncharacterized protein LOC109335131 isoform X2 [Lupinus angustifolius]